MPSVSKKQRKFFEAIAHSSEFAKKAGVPQSVGREFANADKAQRAIGGALATAKKYRASGGSAAQEPWYIRHAAERELRAPSMPKLATTVPAIPVGGGNLMASTPLGKALASSPKVSAVKPQFPKLPNAPKLPKMTMKRGGEVESRNEPFSAGGIIGTTGGTDDKVNTKVADNSFIIPSRVVCALGDGNTLAGMAKLHKMFPPSKTTGGGRKNAVDVALSDGEVALTPDWVQKIGHGDYDRGHMMLKKFCEHVIAQEIEKLKHLPKPTLDKNS